LQYHGDNLHFAKEVLPELVDLVLRFKAVLGKGAGATAEDHAQLAKQEATLDLDYTRATLGSVLVNATEGVAQIEKIVRAMKMFENVAKQARALVAINPVVENATVVSTHAWSSVAHLSLRLATDLPFVPCLAGEIGQVVINLVVNAAQAIAKKFGSEGNKGLIVVETIHERQAECAIIQVTDDGEGIREEIRDKIFDPFFSTRPVGQGTGQGLAQVQAAVTGLHGGTVSFSSEVGKGTTFTVRLPLTAFEGKTEVHSQTGINDNPAPSGTVGRLAT